MPQLTHPKEAACLAQTQTLTRRTMQQPHPDPNTSCVPNPYSKSNPHPNPNQVMPSTDPLDAADFNPTAHINRLFPNEESLSEVDAHVGGLQERMRELDEEVLRTVRQQTSAGSSARKDLENAKASVAELFLKVRDIKTKAEQSEEMVHEICHDIKSLDYAKRHLT